VTQVIYSDRSRVIAYQRCKRLRWLEYSEGPAGVGLVPRRRSIHLVVGSAVHSGMEVLLRDSQTWLDDNASAELTLADQLDRLFTVQIVGCVTTARLIEDRAVAAALGDLRAEFSEGVELDPEEQAAQQAAKQADGTAAPQTDMGGLVAGMSSNSRQEDSPIVIEFDGMVGPVSTAIAAIDPALSSRTYESNEEYLRQEIAALVEGMVRCYSRRRLRPLLEQFQVQEIEHEGEWTLAQFDMTGECSYDQNGRPVQEYVKEIHFLSRHDALLLERSTGYLYLQSFKTTGSWDRRKEMDAQVDMQGLSEAVDVEKRFGEAHQLLAFMSGVEAAVKRNKEIDPIVSLADNPEYLDSQQRVGELVSDRVAEWLRSLPDPPQILGVRYEYLLKGSRRKDKKDASQPDRYIQDSILCRAWKQEGITSDDRRWAWTYDWTDEGGKGRRLDYRSWVKSPVWKFMPVADWIDLLDEGKVQEGALTEQGEPMDALAGQFVPVLTVYRQRDSFYDLMESMEFQETQIAKDVAEVREAERTGGYAAKRSALNRRFPRTLTACSYPGKCGHWECCHGAPDIQVDPMGSGLFVERIPNHPREGLVQIDV
jgi:hypothetical protein